MEYDLVCLGCGPAGERAATEAARLGKRVAVVEREVRPGGAMVNTGTLPSKSLRQTAIFMANQRRAAGPWRLGLRRAQQEGMPRDLSVAQFMARCREVQALEHDRIEADFDEHGVSVHHGRGCIVDPHRIEVLRDDGSVTSLTSQFILIATGSSPLRSASAGLSHRLVVDADGILALERLPASLVVIGGGVIGCEYASIFAEIGCRVTIIEPRETILPFLDGEIRQALLSAMQAIGIRILSQTSVTGVADGMNEQAIRTDLSDGTTLESECVLYAMGRRGNTEGIGLDNVGVDVDRRGQVRVDCHCRTSVESIYAAGDVIGFPALASTSMMQGVAAVAHMFGLASEGRLEQLLPLGIYTIPAVASVGLTVEEARGKGCAAESVTVRFCDNARGRIRGAPAGDAGGILKIVFEAPSGRLLGAQIFGDEAGELIHLAQHILHVGRHAPALSTIQCLSKMVFTYPSLSEAYGTAAKRGVAMLQKLRAGREDAAGRAA